MAGLEAGADDYITKPFSLTAGTSSGITYESKEIVRKNFQGFQQMFLLLGGALCAIVGLVGILNFFNATMTGILYAGFTILISIVFILIMEPLTGRMLESMFWFFEYHFNITAVWITAPVFLVMGIILPLAVYRMSAKRTIVERLREAE